MKMSHPPRSEGVPSASPTHVRPKGAGCDLFATYYSRKSTKFTPVDQSMGVLMRLFKSALMASVCAGIALPAMAADMPSCLHQGAAAPAPVEVYSWTGFYLGGNLGGKWSRYHSTITSGNGSVLGFSGEGDASFVGGGQLGYMWQTGQFVFGVEGDIDATRLSKSFTAVTGAVRSSPATPLPFAMIGRLQRAVASATPGIVRYSTSRAVVPGPTSRQPARSSLWAPFPEPSSVATALRSVGPLVAVSTTVSRRVGAWASNIGLPATRTTTTTHLDC